MQAITTSELLLQQIADDLRDIKQLLSGQEPPVVVDIEEPAPKPARKKAAPAKKSVSGR